MVCLHLSIPAKERFWCWNSGSRPTERPPQETRSSTFWKDWKWNPCWRECSKQFLWIECFYTVLSCSKYEREEKKKHFYCLPPLAEAVDKRALLLLFFFFKSSLPIPAIEVMKTRKQDVSCRAVIATTWPREIACVEVPWTSQECPVSRNFECDMWQFWPT